MSTVTQDDIFNDVVRTLSELHGHDYSGSVEPGTRFFADLGLASIDTVVLGEALEHRYGRRLPFAELMAELGQRADRDMPVAELVGFLHRHLGHRGDQHRS